MIDVTTMIEQAVFTSAQTERSAGYQVVARSPGVDEAEARDLAVWCPSHDSLLDCSPQAASVNFHPLSSGRCCVSRTVAAGWEYSGRGGHRVYTHCLIFSAETLARFANNPFSLLRAAMAHGTMTVGGDIPSRLEGFVLPGSAAAVDQDLLSRLAANPGPLRLALLVQAALESRCLAVFGPPSAEKLIAGLISCLPPECRPEFSFCTGLKYSSRRPFRLIGASGDPAEMRWLSHQPNVTVLDLSRPPACSEAALEGWARLIYRLLSARRITLLAAQLSKPRPELTTADLPALALQLLEDLEAQSLRGAFQPAATSVAADGAEQLPPPVVPQPRQPSSQREGTIAAQGQSVPAEDSSANCPSSHTSVRPSDADSTEYRSPRPAGITTAHAAHRKFAKTGQADGCGTASEPPGAELRSSRDLPDQSPEVLEQLEHLDDVVFDAMAGSTTALEELRSLWPRLLADLGEEILADSREQYLRWGLSNLESRLDPEANYDPDRALQVVEVMCLLFDNV